MNVFCHINEFEVPGFALLGSTLRFSSKLSLWSPSPWLMMRSQSEGASLVGPTEMLTLIERGYIVIMGRTDWLTDKASRSSSEWEGARWFPDYDDVISRWAIEDEFKTQKRVMLLGLARDARGYRWADEQYGNEIWKRALDRYRAEELPQVLLTNSKRLEDASGIDSAVTRILRDARNHIDAFNASDGPTMPLEPAEHGYFAFDIIREWEEANTRNVPASNAETAAAHLFDLLKFCATLKPPETSRELFESLQDSRREELITEIGQWADQRVPISELHRKIRNSVSSEDFLEQLRTGHGDFDLAAALAGLIVPVLTDRYRKFVLHGKHTEVTRRNFLYLTLAAVGLGAYGVGDLVWPKTAYCGPTFPFLLAYGTAHPTHTQIEEMLDKLETYLQSH